MPTAMIRRTLIIAVDQDFFVAVTEILCYDDHIRKGERSMNEKPFEVKAHDVHLDANYADWLRNVKARYRASKVKAAVKVNSEQPASVQLAAWKGSCHSSRREKMGKRCCGASQPGSSGCLPGC